MPLPPRLFSSGKGHVKRDDDRKRGSKSPFFAVWMHRRLPMRKNVKKTLVCLVILMGLYYFFKNMSTDLQNPTSRPNYDHSSVGGMKSQGTPYGSRPATGYHSKQINKDETTDKPKHWFDGPIKFYQLAASLRAISITRGGGDRNRNVIFAASSVKSASILLPLACEMSSYKRNHVHFAFLGRDQISMQMLKEVNGVEDGCDMWFHDGRPDFSVESSEFRMEVSVSAALSHINNFMHPQAVIVDSSGMEDEFLIRAFREKAPRLGRTLIELPKNTEQNLMWITRLDSVSLRAWNKVSVDIIIHAQPSASGSLLRLLRSLSKADYFGSPPPRLTIELPHKIDEPTDQFLKDFTWPPSYLLTEGNSNQLFLHHCIPHHSLTPEENAIRFLESFWPANPTYSHVVVLSPQAELSSLFYHYLKYTILEYRYSESWATESSLMGISLDLPSTYLNDTANFTPPRYTDNKNTAALEVPFLWQAPNSNAALYFGDKWVELQSFVSSILSAPKTSRTKLVSKTYPSWIEDILRLARIRGYYMLYSHLSDGAALATIHNELYQPPEEFSYSSEREDDADSIADFTDDPAHHLSLQHAEMPLASTTLLNILPFKGPPPSLYEIPLLSWSGETMDRTELDQSAISYSEIFRREFGGCGSNDPPRLRRHGSVTDLFCVGEITEVQSQLAVVLTSSVAPAAPSPTLPSDERLVGSSILVEGSDEMEDVRTWKS